MLNKAADAETAAAEAEEGASKACLPPIVASIISACNSIATSVGSSASSATWWKKFELTEFQQNTMFVAVVAFVAIAACVRLVLGPAIKDMIDETIFVPHQFQKAMDVTEEAACAHVSCASVETYGTAVADTLWMVADVSFSQIKDALREQHIIREYLVYRYGGF
uniref:Uncharacterized protein n=1 Tax=Craspedostauros australis TaxID=1486917 RepID=A0A7R9ZL93_9STRA|mmetsp:Transcript_15534/g.42922  ORF Transcript_15534/g.42922 Transcript_15534/m.42922 type:complete len:165 (-) Transcript_15534:223-717(-)